MAAPNVGASGADLISIFQECRHQVINLRVQYQNYLMSFDD